MNELVEKRDLLIERLIDCSEFLRGSITAVCSSCNRAKCICSEKSNSKRKAYRLTYKDSNQKSHTVSIAKSKLQKAHKMVENYSKLRKLIDELQIVNIEIFKQEENS